MSAMNETLLSAMGACIVTFMLVVARVCARRVVKVDPSVPVRVRASAWFISFLLVGALASCFALTVGAWALIHALVGPTLIVTRMLVPGTISVGAALVLAYTVIEVLKAVRQDYDVTDNGIYIRKESRHEQWSNIRRVRVPTLTNISVEFESGIKIQFYDRMNGWAFVVRVLHDRASTVNLDDDDLRRLCDLRL